MKNIEDYKTFVLIEQTETEKNPRPQKSAKHGGVGYDFFNNELTSEIVKSSEWKITKNLDKKGNIGKDVKGDVVAHLIKTIVPDPNKEGKGGGWPLQRQLQEQESLKSRGWLLVWIEKSNAVPSQEIMSADKTITIPFTDSKFFVSGSSKLSEEFKKKFDESMSTIDKDKIIEIEIESSTDKMPIGKDLKKYLTELGLPGDNKGLSIHRANQVVEMIKKLGIPVEKIKITPKVEQGTVPQDPKEQLRRKKQNLGYDDSARYVVLNITTSGDVETVPGEEEKYYYYYERLIPKKKLAPPPVIRKNELEMDWGFCPSEVWEGIGRARKRVWKKIKKFLGFKN